jgi:hypothetical protein
MKHLLPFTELKKSIDIKHIINEIKSISYILEDEHWRVDVEVPYRNRFDIEITFYNLGDFILSRYQRDEFIKSDVYQEYIARVEDILKENKCSIYDRCWDNIQIVLNK